MTEDQDRVFSMLRLLSNQLESPETTHAGVAVRGARLVPSFLFLLVR